MVVLVLGVRGRGERSVLRGQLLDFFVQLGRRAIVQSPLFGHALGDPLIECRVMPPRDGTADHDHQQELDEPSAGVQEFEEGGNRTHGVELRFRRGP